MCWELNIKVQLISGRKKLMPNIMIVFYAGSSFWKAPQRLQEMMDKSKSMEKYYNDWKYFFVDIKEIDTTKIKNSQVRYLVEAGKDYMKEIMKNLKELMMKIDKFNSQQLNMLVEHIFDISNEDDILHLIH